MLYLFVLLAGSYLFYYFTHDITLVAGVFSFFFIILIWAIQHGLSEKREKVDQSLANIDDALQKRHDLLKKMFDLLKGFLSFRREEMEHIERLLSQQGPRHVINPDLLYQINEDQNFLKEILTGKLSGTISESSARSQFERLGESINDVEENLSACRRFYNFSVQSYNTSLSSFPSSLFACLRKMKKKEYFKAEEYIKKEDISLDF